MKIDYTARRVRLSERVKDLVARKLEKLEKVLPGDAQAKVVVRSEKNGVAVEVTVIGRQRTWTATEVAEDQEAAAQAVLDRIVAQAKKSKAKVKEEKKHRSDSVRTNDAWTEAKPGNGRSRPGSRRETVSPRAMFEEDALTHFSASRREVLVYRDLSDDGLRFLYRRRDGTIAVVVPE